MVVICCPITIRPLHVNLCLVITNKNLYDKSPASYSPYIPQISPEIRASASNQAVDRLKLAALLMHEASLVGVLHFAFPDATGRIQG
jgi:hypothetical protein